MSIFLLKSLLSFVMLLCALVASVTMLELFGVTEKHAAVDRLKRVHKAAGLAYVAIFAAILLLCMGYVGATKTELNPRSALHAGLGFAIFAMFAFKMAFVKKYKLFYNQARTLGIAIAICSVVLVGITGGYYVFVTELGGNEDFYSKRLFFGEQRTALRSEKEMKTAVTTTSSGSVERGGALFREKCIYCHDPESAKNLTGPGLCGILRKPLLPVSKRPATPEVVTDQLRHPYDKMPSFATLSDSEIADIIAYLKTL